MGVRKAIRTSVVFVLGATALAMGKLGCAAEVPPPPADVEESVAALRSRRVFFGHQSVGGNILDGLRALPTSIASEPLRGRITPGTIAEALIGANGDPRAKISGFAEKVRALDGGADILLMKLCYVDFEDELDVDALFAHYRATVDALADERPTTTVAHVTVPLTTIESGPKALVKSLLDKPRYGVAQNMRRERFNALLRATYGPAGTVFDLATVESTALDGTHLVVEGVPALVPAYTDDGGHLNAVGQRVVAGRFATFLARLPIGVDEPAP